ncbi:zinc finger protein 558-like [Battus philenor]|uniref:zinc finger protein 558-like n=1 Tax=Battus philenor TaxID=42288 RepID=UPI0035D00A34
MCSRCLFYLRQMIIFKRTCESSDKQLRNLKNCSDFGPENLKERIVQYCIYKLFFPNDLVNESKVTDEASNQNDTFLSSKKKLKTKHSTQHTLAENGINQNISVDEICDQKPRVNYMQEADRLLDAMESLNKTGPEISTDALGIRRKTLLKRRKLLKSNQIKSKTSKINVSKPMKIFKCRICYKVLANQLTYKQHMQRHTGCRFMCEHCGKGFPVRAELNIHRVARHGTGPYLQCQHCAFKAPRKFDLKEHERIHTGERPYACDKCGLTFRRRGIWRKHMIYHGEKNIQCTQCPRKFYQRSAMLAHANNIHNRMYVYLCNKCGITYAKPATVRRHLTERHGIPREMQGKVIRVNKVAGGN